MRQERVHSVILGLTDMAGRLKGKTFDAGVFLDRIADSGAGMCAYVLATDVDMNPLPDFDLSSWDTGYGDLHLVPDLNTIRLLPWSSGTVLVHADASINGRPVSVAPRQMLRRQLDELSQRGLHAKVGLETEFVVYRGRLDHARIGSHQKRQPITARNRDCSLDHDARTHSFLSTLQTSLREAELPTEAVKIEAGHGQLEVTFPYGKPLDAADGHIAFKHAVRRIATDTNLTPTFMAVPDPGVHSGLHMHLSLWNDHGPTLMNSDGTLSTQARHAIAGLLTVLPELAPLYAPTVNSYRRYKPDTFAPTTYSWGHDNRTCAVRVTGQGQGLHLELRLPGADANPYLGLTAVLAAIQHGLDQEDLLLPPPSTGSAYTGDAPPVPNSLADARAVFRDSALARKLLGDDVVDHYVCALGAEISALESAQNAPEVTNEERQRWLAAA
ncbi:glutamine synthetase family protein [Streptomyces botrytidirepellens]|uniref:glutamine synthetase family protein n=1 Tax=Streptomyces botrytidirepellens TaxID=2486417 RepID=UPI001FE73F21|nr:glutamine synthetase family protein [Streptomyces botrytidirepellens]